ncbi:hypothetical protein RN001_002379 [Aquatica leii]|uniref:DDE Tnp4 domain-containing protein n=1 Tax=Aquatica leii TaxID=1421715 RepID=A0AAN7SR76_9COLE|nr:hypothetical protein RN001_002379 [Aquatica leii]
MDDEIMVMLYILLEEDEARNQMRLFRRGLRDTQNPFETSDLYFKKTFRFSKELALMLINQLTPHLYSVRSTAIPAYLKVLVTLHFLGHGVYQHGAGLSSVTSLSQPVISRSISIVCRLISEHLMPEWISFPITNEKKTIIKQSFFDKFGFRGVLGCIDGTHVEIIAPPVTDLDHPPHVYINRKGYHSINVMLICDSNCRIIACDARYPGSVHDAAIWRMSDVRNYCRGQYENGDITSHLIGDSGYGLEPWLFVPFARVVPGSPEAMFNELLTSTRNCIERTNGILKGRFRCLLRHRVLHYTPDKAAYIIYASAVLHNIAVLANLQIDDEVVFEENDDPVRQPEIHENNLLQLGRMARTNYIRQNI